MKCLCRSRQRPPRMPSMPRYVYQHTSKQRAPNAPEHLEQLSAAAFLLFSRRRPHHSRRWVVDSLRSAPCRCLERRARTLCPRAQAPHSTLTAISQDPHRHCHRVAVSVVNEMTTNVPRAGIWSTIAHILPTMTTMASVIILMACARPISADQVL